MQLPSDFIANIKPLLNDDWDVFVSALKQEAPTSIRLNTEKCKEALSFDRVKWSDSGYYLNTRPQFTFDPVFHAGGYYVQEASSMFVEQAIRQYIEGDVKFLDLCAAPGGKSTLVASLLSGNSLLVANEVIRPRANVLAENMIKWGYPNVVVANNDSAQIGQLEGYFDAILIDAPCSGEGMFRKDEGAIEEWSVNNVMLCRDRQQEILANIWPALKAGGILIYSTCTYNKEENEENVLWIKEELGADILPVEIKEEWGISPAYISDIPAYHFFPHKVRGEGLFVAVLRKQESNDYISVNRKYNKDKSRDKKKRADVFVDYQSYLKNKDSFAFYEQADKYYAFPKCLKDELDILKSRLNILSEGICLGQMKGKDFIPDQSLAFSLFLNKERFDMCEVDWRTAVAYLRKEAVVLDNEPKGYILLTYKNLPLGFVKNVGNRANNLYPTEWRIRSSYLPEEKVDILGVVDKT